MEEQNVVIENRQMISFTGVKDVGDFSEELVNVYTLKGGCIVKGKGLKMQKLDLEEGKVIVEGNIISLTYTDKKEKDDVGLLGKIFR